MDMKCTRQKQQELLLDISPIACVKKGNGYSPLPSIWSGEDSELIDKMLAFYPRRKPKDILDATVNGGRFWRGLKWHVIGMDIDPKHKPDVVGDNTNMPFDNFSFDVVVYDPPHIPNQGKDRSKDFNTRFGLTLKSPKEEGYNFAFMYPPFAKKGILGLAARGDLTLQDCRLHSRASLPMGTHRLYRGRQGRRILPVRLHREGSAGTDHRPTMEEGPPRPAAALLLACFSEVS